MKMMQFFGSSFGGFIKRWGVADEVISRVSIGWFRVAVGFGMPIRKKTTTTKKTKEKQTNAASVDLRLRGFPRPRWGSNVCFLFRRRFLLFFFLFHFLSRAPPPRSPFGFRPFCAKQTRPFAFFFSVDGHRKGRTKVEGRFRGTFTRVVTGHR